MNNLIINEIEKEIRKIEQIKINSVKSKTNYGITFLDKSLGSIKKGEFVLICADSGVGKSQLLYDIAFNNAKNKFNVLLIALEAFEGEPTARLKYKYISNEYYKRKYNKDHGNIYYDFWLENKYNFLTNLEIEANKFLLDNYESMKIVYKTNLKDFNVNSLCKLIESYKDKLDIVFIDHIHYFDLIGMNQYKEEGLLAKKIKFLAENYGVPIVCNAHIRKNRDKECIIHDEKDIMGSSDIYKNATSIIALAPYYESQNFLKKEDNNILYPTSFRICKARYRSAIKPWLIGVHNYDIRTNFYQTEYNLHKLNKNASKSELLSFNEYPDFLK